MAEDELEVNLNSDENYLADRPQEGMLSSVLSGAAREQYMKGSFKQLVKYVLNTQVDLDEEQQSTRSMLTEKLGNETPTSRLIVKLYDQDNQQIMGNSYPVGDIYLEDIVEDNVGSDVDTINIAISSCSSVG